LKKVLTRIFGGKIRHKPLELELMDLSRRFVPQQTGKDPVKPKSLRRGARIQAIGKFAAY
jgi:hypothetical protein